MYSTTIKLAQSLGILSDRTPCRSRLRSILIGRRYGKNEESRHNSLDRLDDRPLADVGLYCEHGIHNLENQTDRQPGSPVPVALLAIWMPPV